MSARKAVRPRWCNWHKGLASSALLVRVLEAASGPGGMLYACRDCRVRHSLTPLTERSI